MTKLPDRSFSVSIVIPAYNEEKNIKSAVVSAYTSAKRVTNNFEIIIMDDNSTDRTLSILKTIPYRELRIIRHISNKGIECSVRDLYNNAKKDYIFFNGADGDINMDVLINFYNKAVSTGADIIVGNRIYKNYSLKRKIISVAYNKLIKIMLGFDVYDAGTVKLVKRKFFSNTQVISTSVFGEAERLVRAIKKGAILEKVDIKQNVIDRNDSVNYNQLLLCLRDLVILSVKIRFGMI